MSESLNKRDFIKFLSNGKTLINHHDEQGTILINPLLHSEDDKARDMILLPVAPKLSRGLLDFYKNVM